MARPSKLSESGFYIYLHCKPDGEPFYVGKGYKDRFKNFSKRSTFHKNIVAKYGKSNIGIFVFPCESEKQAFDDEINTIELLKKQGYSLCNLTPGGEGVGTGNKHSLGCKRSEEFKRKLSIAHKGKKLTPDHCKKISIGKMGCVGFTGKHTEESKKKMSEAKKGIKPSLSTIDAVRKANLGIKRPKEFCDKVSKALKGRKLSQSHCESMSKANKGKPWTKARRDAWLARQN